MGSGALERPLSFDEKCACSGKTPDSLKDKLHEKWTPLLKDRFQLPAARLSSQIKASKVVFSLISVAKP